MSDIDERVTDPAHAQDQSNEHLPWPRLARFAALALGLFTLAGLAAVAVLWNGLGTIVDDRSIANKDVHAAQIGIVEPRLIVLETRAADLAAVRRAQLNEWGWVDREKKLVRMPIERAMQLVVEGKR